MKNFKFLVQAFVAILVLSACRPEEGLGGLVIRDPNVVQAEDLLKLQSFLNTHFYNYDEFQASTTADLEVLFDTIQGANSTKIPLFQQVEAKILRRGGVDYTYYILRARQGEGTGRATFADSALVSYKGYLTNRSIFDASTNPIWFDLPTGVVPGFKIGVIEFNDATSAVQQPDGVITFEGSGAGAVFMPSGLAYFNVSRTGIPAYTPLIFTLQIRKTKTADHDGDGILSYLEDLDGDNSVNTPNGDNTDGDQLFNFLDADDDGDGQPTRSEITVRNADGTIVRDANGNPVLDPTIDTDNDGIPDYLDNNTLGQ
jgi:hypothetical protein